MPMSEGKEEGWGFEDGGREGLTGRSRRRRRGGRRPRAGRRRAPPPAGSNAPRTAAGQAHQNPSTEPIRTSRSHSGTRHRRWRHTYLVQVRVGVEVPDGVRLGLDAVAEAGGLEVVDGELHAGHPPVPGRHVPADARRRLCHQRRDAAVENLEGLRPSRPRRRCCARSNSSSTPPGPPLNKTEIKSMYLHVESFEVRFISRRSASGSPLRPTKLIH